MRNFHKKGKRIKHISNNQYTLTHGNIWLTHKSWNAHSLSGVIFFDYLLTHFYQNFRIILRAIILYKKCLIFPALSWTVTYKTFKLNIKLYMVTKLQFESQASNVHWLWENNSVEFFKLLMNLAQLAGWIQAPKRERRNAIAELYR